MTLSRFRSALELHVQNAVDEGAELSGHDGDKSCPLGCVPGVYTSRPGPRRMRSVVGELAVEREAFVLGFDGLRLTKKWSREPNLREFWEYGREMRRRFP